MVIGEISGYSMVVKEDEAMVEWNLIITKTQKI
jgi:hypothetical protein